MDSEGALPFFQPLFRGCHFGFRISFEHFIYKPFFFFLNTIRKIFLFYE